MSAANFPYSDLEVFSRDSLRYLYVAGSVLNTMNAAGQLAPEVMAVFGPVRGVLESLFTMKLGVDEMIYATDKAKANHTRKKAYAAGNIISGAVLFAATAVSSTASAFALTTYMWASAIRSAQKLHRAYQKTDLRYLFDDRLEKYRFIKKKIANSYHRKEKQELMQIKTRLEKQLVAISIYYDNYNVRATDDREHFDAQLEDQGIKKNSMDRDEAKTIVKYLQTKQEEKVVKAWYSTFTWTCAAAGMTLIAIAAVCPPAAPILLAVGASLCVASSVFKLKESYEKTFKPWLTNRKLRQQVYKDKDYKSSFWLDLFPTDYRKDGHRQAKETVAFEYLQAAEDNRHPDLRSEVQEIKKAFAELGIKKPREQVSFSADLAKTSNKKQVDALLEQCMKLRCKEKALEAKGYKDIEPAISAKDMVRFGI